VFCGLSVGLSPSEPFRKSGSDRDTVCVQDSGGPRERPITYSGPLRANTVLCSFNAIQPSSLLLLYHKFIAKSVGENNENRSTFGKVSGKI